VVVAAQVLAAAPEFQDVGKAAAEVPELQDVQAAAKAAATGAN
jgi:hypothetical protein